MLVPIDRIFGTLGGVLILPLHVFDCHLALLYGKWERTYGNRSILNSMEAINYFLFYSVANNY